MTRRVLLLGVVVLRLHLSSRWGMSRRGRRDVEEGIVKVEHSGVFGVHERRVEVREVRKGVRILGESRRTLEQLRGMG